MQVKFGTMTGNCMLTIWPSVLLRLSDTWSCFDAATCHHMPTRDNAARSYAVLPALHCVIDRPLSAWEMQVSQELKCLRPAVKSQQGNIAMAMMFTPSLEETRQS